MEPVVGDSKFSCSKCKNLLAHRKDLLSKALLVKSGQAYLFSNVMNIVVGEKMDAKLLSGAYTIAGISCSQCGEPLGWKYIKAQEMKGKFKEGKFVLEKVKLVKEYKKPFFCVCTVW